MRKNVGNFWRSLNVSRSSFPNNSHLLLSSFSFILILILAFASTPVFSQKGSKQDNRFGAEFDLLNNKPFAELELEDTAGRLFNTTSLLGKTIYVDFWFTVCPPCIKEIPYSKSLQKYFAQDSSVVFLNICIESIDRKANWKQMIRDNEIPGIHLFYARNRPQKINLLRAYYITFPTYLLVNKEMKVIGYNAPRPSEQGWVHWAIAQAAENIPLSAAYKKLGSKEYLEFEQNREKRN